MNITALAHRSGDWWAVAVPEVDGCFTQAASVGEIGDMAVDAAATLLSIEPATVHLARMVVCSRDACNGECETQPSDGNLL